MSNVDDCILCHAFRFRVIHKKGPWQYLRCVNCGLVSLSPRPTPEELRVKYQTYLPENPQAISEWEAMTRPVNIKSADLIESHVKTDGKRILDIGCGYGFFLREMKSRGWHAEGVEVSRTGRHYAQEKWGIPVYSKALERLDLPGNAFDVVTLHYVLEHVHDPCGLLKEVHRILKPSGLILLRCPHSTPIVMMLRPVANKLDVFHTPYHLYDFSPKTMNEILILNGFMGTNTLIGGYTRPSRKFSRWVSILFGQLGEWLCFLSKGRLLFPGLSKTTIAYKSILNGSGEQKWPAK